MRLLFSRHLKLRHLAISIALIATAAAIASTTGVLASTTGLPLGISTACGCEAPPKVGLGPVGGLTFTAGKKEQKRITITNVGTIRAKLVAQNIINEKPAGSKNYKAEFVTGGPNPCEEFEIELAPNGSCEVGVTAEGMAGVTAEYQLQYGPYIFTPYEATLPLKD